MAKSKKHKFKYDTLLVFGSILVSFYFIYSLLLFNNVESLIRYTIVFFILFFDIYLWKKVKKKKRRRKLLILLAIITILFYSLVGSYLSRGHALLDGLNKQVTYSSSLVTLSTNSTKISDIKNQKIGLLDNEASVTGYILPYQLLEKHHLTSSNEIIQYNDFTALITALYENEVSYIFLPSSYIDIYGEDFENLDVKTKELDKVSKTEKKETLQLSGSSKDISKPFTMLLMGIDSTTQGLSQSDSFNGDSLILITFNPTTLRATMLSIPRDSYVPITCFDGMENKITHAASQGTKCVIDTIENFMGITIDYYAKINFTGLVDLIDELGGIEVNVPYSFCEQNSQRKFGKYTIYVKQGKQVLNGEEALALSRNRKKNSSKCSSEWTQGTRSDFVRAQNQQLVIKALINKVKTIRSIDQILDLLEIIADNMDTNMDTNTILSFYNVAKDIFIKTATQDELIQFEQLTLVGYGQYIYDERTKLQLWNYVLNKPSIEDVVKEMRVNLELDNYEAVKEFSYSINEVYVKKNIGKGPYTTYTTYDLLPDLTTYHLSTATQWAYQNSITLDVTYVSNSLYSNGKILEQSYPVNKRLDLIENKTVAIKVVKN